MGFTPFLGRGSWVPNYVAGAEADLRAKFHLGPSNRFDTVYQRHRQDRQTKRTDRQTDRQTDNGLIARGEPFYRRSPKNYPAYNSGLTSVTD